LVFNPEFLLLLQQVELEGEDDGEGDVHHQTFLGVDLHQLIGEVAEGGGDEILEGFADGIINFILSTNP